MRKFWGTFDVVVVVLATIILGYQGIATYRTEWEFGPKYGMPVLLLAPDGMHYLDGEEAGPIGLMLARNGIEEEYYVVGLGLNAIGLAYLFHLKRQTKAMVKRIEERRAAAQDGRQ